MLQVKRKKIRPKFKSNTTNHNRPIITKKTKKNLFKNKTKIKHDRIKIIGNILFLNKGFNSLLFCTSEFFKQKNERIIEQKTKNSSENFKKLSSDAIIIAGMTRVDVIIITFFKDKILVAMLNNGTIRTKGIVLFLDKIAITMDNNAVIKKISLFRSI